MHTGFFVAAKITYEKSEDKSCKHNISILVSRKRENENEQEGKNSDLKSYQSFQEKEGG